MATSYPPPPPRLSPTRWSLPCQPHMTPKGATSIPAEHPSPSYSHHFHSASHTLHTPGLSAPQLMQTDRHTDSCGFQIQLCLAGKTWTRHLASLNLSFIVCKTGCLFIWGVSYPAPNALQSHPREFWVLPSPSQVTSLSSWGLDGRKAEIHRCFSLLQRGRCGHNRQNTVARSGVGNLDWQS